MADEDKNNIYEKLLNRIKKANDVLLSLNELSINGITKLQNKIRQEIQFLNKIHESGKIKREHLKCSNLKHLEAIACHVIQNQNICVAIMTNKLITSPDGTSRKLCVDLILNGGSTWVKIVARNSKALTQLWLGDGAYGQKNIVDQAAEFVECGSQHLHYYKPPEIIFYFAYGVDDCLSSALKNINVTVMTSTSLTFLTRKPNSQQVSDDVMIKCPVTELDVSQNFKAIENMGPDVPLNLGVTTMIAYVSALTNGGTNYKFKSEILTNHARWERLRPVKPILDRLFEGRQLHCCQTARDNFANILYTLGGPSERVRGENLLSRIQVVEDHPELISSKIRAGNRVKLRSLAIFGTGEYLKAITVTANHAFVRSCLNQGIQFPVFLHESRALTEGKQLDLL